MPQRLGGTFTFPGTDLTVHRLGYGAMQLAGPHVFGPPKDRDAALDVLREAVSLGIDHIDTSDYYGPHVTNEILHEALHPYPRGLVIVTKVGAYRDEEGAWLPDMSQAGLTKAVEDNLGRLGLRAMDIVNLRLMEKDGDLEGPLRTLVRLKEQGLIRHIGISNVSPAQVRAARQIAPIVCVQNEYNIANRGDDALIDELAEAGIAYVPFFPLGGFSPLQSETLDAVARDLEAPPRSVAIAWLLQRAPNVLLIPGTSSVDHLRENVRAAELTLPPDALERLDGIAAQRG
ncbi:oxidoreductase [Parvularcula dongshanensis]|uniref:Aryl-alcohol dehydrogenase-like predicted oxidoreductase n=1 Tax=Parvularcula dongshanensis TaxID=1173995 RepID=A0A840I6X3_9PROT|nr:oxidoreductase [Parvularcula dongshanensis]MBB4660065.1 aryl-alcohol dehydrogenase-like predicted oxidoreductase [Parvularcula dongshanensis]